MPETTPAPATAKDRLLVALDVERLDDADALLERLAGEISGCTPAGTSYSSRTRSGRMPII